VNLGREKRWYLAEGGAIFKKDKKRETIKSLLLLWCRRKNSENERGLKKYRTTNPEKK